MEELMTTEQAATELKITVRAVQKHIERGRLPAKKIGRDWLIKRSDLDKVRNLKPGRPKKIAP